MNWLKLKDTVFGFGFLLLSVGIILYLIFPTFVGTLLLVIVFACFSIILRLIGGKIEETEKFVIERRS